MEPNVNAENETVDPAKGEVEIETVNIAVVKEKNPAVANLESKIIKQLEFYFSDTNLPYDKFLQSETKADDGWVKISVLLTFKRLASISSDPLVIVSAVKNAVDSILEVDEANEKIRRKIDNAVPVADQEYLNELIERSIYCKGFPKTATMDELLEYAATFGDKTITKVTPRRLKTKEFKGTLYFTFSTKEQADEFLKRESVQYNGVELERMWEKDFLEEKKKEFVEKQAKKNEKIKAETEKYFKKGFLLKADNLNKDITVDGIKAMCSGFEWEVSFVKIVDDNKSAWIRLKPIKAAKDLLENIASKKDDLSISFSIPDEEIEQQVLNEMTKEMKGILNMKDKMKRERNKNKGGKRYGNKRKNDEYSNSNKKLKNGD